MCVSDASSGSEECNCCGRLRHAGNRWQRRSRLEGSARLVTRLDAEVAVGPEAPAMQGTLPAAPASPLHEWEPAWSARCARLYWWNKITRESRWDPRSTASREARSSSQKEIPVKAHPSSSPTNRPGAGRVPGELTPKGAHASVALWRCAEQRDERTSASITVVPSPVLDPANLWHSLH